MVLLLSDFKLEVMDEEGHPFDPPRFIFKNDGANGATRAAGVVEPTNGAAADGAESEAEVKPDVRMLEEEVVHKQPKVEVEEAIVGEESVLDMLRRKVVQVNDNMGRGRLRIEG